MNLKLISGLFILSCSVAYAATERNLYNKDNAFYKYTYDCGCGVASGAFHPNNAQVFQDSCDKLNKCTLTLDNGSTISIEPTDRSNIVIKDGRLSLIPNP